ncbi:heat-inducible transcriptional repressor HrcA [Micrococcales bacterium 31B]|nr:heat-inducible transcriptional repressor HrcA [Micrococcales bacterium 31B]
MSDERRLEILRAIVTDYVQTREPVASKHVGERHNLGVSPATIRNDMAQLEEEGLITQPHTSAGRIPTDAGYRSFVNHLGDVKRLSEAERRAMTTLMEGADDLDDLLERAVRILANLTHQVAVVQYPSLAQARVHHLEVVSMRPGLVMLVLITDSGQVDQKTVAVDAELNEADLALIKQRLNETLHGLRVTDAVTALPGVPELLPQAVAQRVGPVLAALHQVCEAKRQDRIVLAGRANLARSGADFVQTLDSVLDAIEEQVVLLRLLHNMVHEAGETSVLIGHEVTHEGLVGTSLVATGYAAGEQPLTRMGVLGPTRMNYPLNISAVRAVATYVSRYIDRA